MRLIDANALREEVEFHVTSVSVCGKVAEAQGMTRFKGICLDDIDNAPTIKAIPVSWVEKMMLEGEPEDSKAAWRVLREWKKGREGE